jgi:cyanophycinase
MAQKDGNGNGNGRGRLHNRTLIIIGGHEEKRGDRVILREVARQVRGGKLVVTTVASHEPEGAFEEYERVFHDLGVKQVECLEIRERIDATDERRLRVLDDAGGVFFTGGDQLKITSQIGDTPIFRRVHEIYHAGGLIAGTSAGASVMSDTMLVSGPSEETHRVGDSLRMAPGLGLISGVIIDQHFAERGRMGRLLGAVAQNPRILGIGIDEQTAIVVENEERFTVLGDGAVYVIDGTGVTHSNITEDAQEMALSIYDVKLHVLSHEDQFDLRERRPGAISRDAAIEVQIQEARAEPLPRN